MILESLVADPHLPNRALISRALTFILLTLLAGCATAPKASGPSHFRPIQSEFGQWRGSGKVTRAIKSADGVRKENWSISVEIVMRTPGYGRIEVTGAMGVYGGTIAWTPQGTRVLLPAQRKFIFSDTSASAFRSVLPIELSPLWLEQIVFRNELTSAEMKSAGFLCVKQDAGDLREVCKSGRARIERWYGADGQIHIAASSQSGEGDAGSLELELAEIRSKVKEREALWALEPPRGFKVNGAPGSRPKSSL